MYNINIIQDTTKCMNKKTYEERTRRKLSKSKNTDAREHHRPKEIWRDSQEQRYHGGTNWPTGQSGMASRALPTSQ